MSESLLVILFVGLAAGWLAGHIVQGTGFGLIGDMIIGIIGAFIGDWLLPQLGVQLGAGLIGAIANATIGAILTAARHQVCSRWRRPLDQRVAYRLGPALVTGPEPFAAPTCRRTPSPCLTGAAIRYP